MIKHAVILIMLLASANLFAKSTFSGDRLREACIDYVYSIHGNDIEVAISKSINDEVFEDDNISARLVGSKNNLRGQCYIIIEFLQEDRMVRRVEVAAKIKLYGLVPVATRYIRKGEEVDNSMFSYDKKEITYLNAQSIANIEDLYGKVVKQNITTGTVLTGGLFENNVIIHRGDEVRVVAQSGAVRISSTAKALQDASVGQRIRIKRDGTRNILDGYVATDGSVFIITN